MSSTTILISIATSFIASWFFFLYLGFREKKIKSQLRELSSEEEYIEKLSKGNIKLLRSSFVIILITFSCLLISLAIFFIGFAIDVEGKLKIYLNGSSAWLVLVAASMCVYQARSIIRSSDLGASKLKIKKQREHLESKLK